MNQEEKNEKETETGVQAEIARLKSELAQEQQRTVRAQIGRAHV